MVMVTDPPVISAPAHFSAGLKSPRLGWFVAGMLGFSFLLLCTVVFFFNPSTSSFYPVCQFHQVTGWNCPGCGATRGLYALLHGQWRVALRDNVLLVGALVIAPLRGSWWLWRRSAGHPLREFVPAAWLWPL